ncbi:hypothetical protein FB451DRAFT_1165221 [Mycena latifolia]|nr:hypothetical protein FB451DRAFT_1165221 [Mycena latifolia]
MTAPVTLTSGTRVFTTATQIVSTSVTLVPAPTPTPAATGTSASDHSLSHAELGGIVVGALLGALFAALLVALLVRWQQRRRRFSASSSFFPRPRFSGDTSAFSPQDVEAQPNEDHAGLDLEAALDALELAGPALDVLLRPGPGARTADVEVMFAVPVNSCAASVVEEKDGNRAHDRDTDADSTHSAPPDYASSCIP